MASRRDLYTGPFPRKRHSHRCKGCESWGQLNGVACYKSQCTRPQLTDSCSHCKSREPAGAVSQSGVFTNTVRNPYHGPNTGVRPEDSLPLPTMPNVDAERAAAAGIAEGESLTARMLQPGRDVSAKAGKMERDSPLFFGTGDNPTLF